MRSVDPDDADATIALVTRPSFVRRRTEDYERASLSTWATLATDSKGRERAEDTDPLRTAFQQDRDRIVGSGAFRRLADKTQSFLGVSDRLGAGRDQMRLTHALEVAQVARTLARALRLNEDLVEAIALGHDLGHTPFGRAGEEALAAFTDAPFRHHEQSVRVVEVLERGGAGLNLTWEVRDGLLHHPDSMPPPATPEGQAVRLASRIVVATRDLEAALQAGVVDLGGALGGLVAGLGPTHDARVATLLEDAVTGSLDQPEVRLSVRVEGLLADLLRVLEARVNRRPSARAQHDRAVHCLQSLVVWSLEHPDVLPPAVRVGDPLVVRVLDEVSAMADAAALAAFASRFLPRGGTSG